MDIEIDEITFIAVRPTFSNLIGFANLRLQGFIGISSLGVHKGIDGKINLTYPATKLKNGTMKFYVEIKDSGTREAIRKAVSDFIDESGYYEVKTKDDFEYEENNKQKF